LWLTWLETRGGHVPIVAMTAHASKEDERRCLDAGMDAYISKPIDFKKSLELIGDSSNKSMATFINKGCAII
jgi:CheY-like chemotaxis protein